MKVVVQDMKYMELYILLLPCTELIANESYDESEGLKYILALIGHVNMHIQFGAQPFECLFMAERVNTNLALRHKCVLTVPFFVSCIENKSPPLNRM